MGSGGADAVQCVEEVGLAVIDGVVEGRWRGVGAEVVGRGDRGEFPQFEMEDQFANILQRNYGLKAVGKSASLGPRSDERLSASARALDRGKSVGSGLGRINQSAAAAVVAAAGDGMGAQSHGPNGASKASGRQSDGGAAYGGVGDQGFRGATK